MIQVNLTGASYAIFGIVVYYAGMFLLSAAKRVPKGSTIAKPKPFIVIVIPAHNEELVLDDTLSNVRLLQYSGSYRVITVNDASIDGTGEIAHLWAELDPRFRVIDRSPQEGGRGKSAVLNNAYRMVLKWCDDADDWLEGRSVEDIVVGILDADGRLAPDCLEIVSGYFCDSSVGTTQIGVRIGNSMSCTLTRMQDMEFVGFSWLVQIARDHLGSSGLGGNGQFTRLSALKSLGGSPWASDALTEDLDLGLSLVEAGWTTRFCHLTYVEQQGLDKWRPLLRQRTRWIQGHYQCWKHIPALLRSRKTNVLCKLDLSLYLLLVTTVVLISGTMLMNILASFGVVQVSDQFFDFIPAGLTYRSCSLVLSVLPVVAFMWTYQRHSQHAYRWYEVPFYAVIFTLYTYVWLLTTARAWARIILRRKSWVKTPRVALDLEQQRGPGPPTMLPARLEPGERSKDALSARQHH